MAAASELNGDGILAAVRGLAPRVRAQANQIEELRRLPDDLCDALIATGAVRMAMPVSVHDQLPSATVHKRRLAPGQVGNAERAVPVGPWPPPPNGLGPS